jgi:hypothetical protein
LIFSKIAVRVGGALVEKSVGSLPRAVIGQCRTDR